ncbi:hypothetical protein DID76_02825 [Candidatus Marinamargulisbacteria bacterium SCGC AG-414-C22]|nr:hypothetical protein DID76_02825 [Candidatus Marinamargulisbacteria bacterium SCGC AG-414-C22]
MELNNTTPLSINDIISILPHKHPFILIDKIIEIQNRKFIVGIKNITINEPYFQGHFSENPIMPGSMILETLSQVGSILFLIDPEYKGRYSYFTALDKIEFHKNVQPGDQLRCEMEVSKIKENEIKMLAHASVDGQTVCKGYFSFQLAIQPSKPQIHPTASVHHSAILGHNVNIGANTIVGENVHIGDNTKIEANCFIEKWTQIGEDCHLHFGSVIGSAAQDAKYKGEKSNVIIGDRNQIREYVTINRATGKDEITQIGSDNLLLTNVHIAHNCKLGNNIVIANMSNLAGHTEIADKVIIGGMTGIHQFVKVGTSCMIGAYTRLVQDLPPYMLCEGNPALIRGLNSIGLRRQGFSKTTLTELKDIYKNIFKSNQNTSMALEELKNHTYTATESHHLINFLTQESSRGFIKKVKKATTSDE